MEECHLLSAVRCVREGGEGRGSRRRGRVQGRSRTEEALELNF